MSLFADVRAGWGLASGDVTSWSGGSVAVGVAVREVVADERGPGGFIGPATAASGAELEQGGISTRVTVDYPP